MIIHLHDEAGTALFARIVRKGDCFGPDMITYQSDDPFIEFYEERLGTDQWWGNTVQHVPRYGLSEFMELPDGTSLNMDRHWTLPPAQVRYVKDRIAYLLDIDHPEHGD